MKLEFSEQIFEKYAGIKFYENPSNGSRVVPGGRTDMTNLRIAFRNFLDATKNEVIAVFIVFLHFGSPRKDRMRYNGVGFRPEVEPLRSKLLLLFHSTTGLQEFWMETAILCAL
jgi:hypothetical protein